MGEERTLIEEFVASTFTPGARLVALREREDGAQGYSGARLRYYDVTYERAGEVSEVAVVTKPAGRNERRVLNWLGERDLPVPRNATRDLATDGPAFVVQEHVGDAPTGEGRAALAARALAAIHHAALGRADEFSWLPRADPRYFAEHIVQHCWRGLWRHLVTGEGFNDGYGRWRESRDGGDPFWAEFADYDAAMEAAAARFVREMTALWDAGESLTLIHADLHGEHVRSRDGCAAIIDWGQAHYGPLYTDLPNYFKRDEALLYRDALAELGHDIPRERFLRGYDAASRYVGFKYFGFGVAFWRPGDPPRRREGAMKWINLVLYGDSRGEVRGL